MSWGRVLVNFALQTATVAGPLIPPNLSWSGRTKHGRGACTPPHAFNYFPIHFLGNERKPHDVDNFRLTWPHMRQIEAAQVLEGLWIYPGFVHFACTKEWCLKMFSEKRLVWPLDFSWEFPIKRDVRISCSTVFASPFSSQQCNVWWWRGQHEC